MNSMFFKIILADYNHDVDKIVIPHVVYDEVISQYEKKSFESICDINEALIKSKKYLRLDIDVDALIDLKSKVLEYTEYLDGIISAYDILILNYPNIEHRDIALKAMSRSKPFKKNGEGYCDSLIWENVKGLASQDVNNSIVFITSNTKDFYENSHLHPSLINELIHLDVSPSNVEIYVSLKEYAQAMIMPKLEILQPITSDIENGSLYGVNIQSWVEGVIYEKLDPFILMGEVLGLSSTKIEFYITEIIRVEIVDSSVIRLVGDNQIYLEILALVEFGYDLCSSWEQYYDYFEIKELFEEYNEPIPMPYGCVQSSHRSNMNLAITVEDQDFNKAILEILI